MALWDVTQTTTYVTAAPGQPLREQQIVNLGVYDDAVKVPNNVMLDFFGVSERKDVQFSSPEPGVFVAKIQWAGTKPTPSGWVADNQSPYDYVVEFRAVRRA